LVANEPSARALNNVAARANQRWSLDFVSDVLADGRRFRVLVIVDDFHASAWLVVGTRSPAAGWHAARYLHRGAQGR
jgi:putative transposase